MGYLRGTQTQAIKGTILLGKSQKNDVGLELKPSFSLSDNYLNQDYSSLDASNDIVRQCMFEVNGDPLDHWKKDNFESKQDSTSRVVYEPKIGKQFFRKTLGVEDYAITRSLVTSLEQPYFSKYNRFFPKKGYFCCKACGNPLYSSKAKFDVDDGWPAFGACVLGSIGVISIEDRMAQIERKENACIKIQAVVRGDQSRHRFENMLDVLIEQMSRRKQSDSRSEEEQDDWSSEGHLSSDSSWSSSSDESIGCKRSSGSDDKYVLSRDMGEDYAEIHCHRCKSLLGDVFAQNNTGNRGETYREHHRVNGRALKFVNGNLPKRTIANASLLFADASQRQRFSLPSSIEDEPSLPYGTLHWLNKSADVPSDPLDLQRKRYGKLVLAQKVKMATSNGQTFRSSRRRPMRRGSTDISTSVAKQATRLEKKVLLITPPKKIKAIVPKPEVEKGENSVSKPRDL